jgi:VCBS repeat-containing protein
MAKLYKLLVNDGNGAEAKPINVMQGAGDKGAPVRIVAQKGVRYELQDSTKAKAAAPDQVRVKRVGKNLTLMFDGSQKPDVVVEDFYAMGSAKDGNLPVLAGLAENGSVYEYIPQDPALSSLTPALADGNTPVLMALGGGALGETFALSALPLVAAAGGVSGWAIAGAAVGAAALGGGGGGGAAAAVLPSGQKGELTHNTLNDTGPLDTDGITNNNKPELTVSAERGAVVVVTVNGKDYAAKETTTAGVYKVQIDDALADGVYTPIIKVTNAAGTSSENGTAFTIDTSSEKNQDATAKPSTVLDSNASAVISIGGIDDGQTNVSSGSLDTGTSKTDFLTSDNTLVFSGLVADFVANGDTVRVQVVKSDNSIALEKYATPSDGKWSVDNQGSTLSDGSYTIKAAIVDAAGNVVKSSSQSLRVAHETAVLIAKNDLKQISEDQQATGNVLDNDADSTVSALSVVSVKAVSKSVSTTVSSTIPKVAIVDGVYGQLSFFEDGHYTYDTNAAGQALLEGEKKTDSFSYEVSADSTRSTRANLDIEVSGVNDVATITTKYGTRTQITNGSLGAAVASDAIIVSDADVDQNDLSTATAVAGAFGLLDLPASTTVGQYGWKYSTSGTKNKSDTIQHDLFTLTSKDGTASTTLDFQLQATSTVTKHVAVGQDKTLDTLMLDTSAGFTLDLTSVERIDITGGQNVINAIQLSLANLTQADNHLLEVVGDSADTVDLSQLKLFLDPAHASTQGVSGVYYVRSNSIDYELHVVNAQVLGLI